MRVTEYGHYTAQAQGSLLDSEATKKALSGDEYVAMLDTIITITMCSFGSTSTLQNFNPADLVFAKIFHVL